jgi:hypothetical protein
MDFGSMNEDRFITLILWGAFILGAAGIAGTYYVKSYHRQSEAPPTVENRVRIRLPEQQRQTMPPPQASVPQAIVLPIEEIRKKEVAEEGEQKERIPAPTLSPAEPGREKPKGEPAVSPLTLPPPMATIQETTKANGSFARAQNITEGVIIGKRGSEGDRTDYYKVRADGRTMVVKVEAALVGKSQYFTVAVFDDSKRRVGEVVEKTRASTTIPVKPQSVYYIKVDLTHAPIQSPNYEVHVAFHDRGVSS